MNTTVPSGPERDLRKHTAVRELPAGAIAAVLLILASALFGLLLAEAGLRM